MPSIENVEPEPEVSMPQASVLRKRHSVRFKNDAVNEPCHNESKTNKLPPPPPQSTATQSKGRLMRQMGVLKVNKKLSGGVKKRTAKKVVFNGTFPIDDPISSRFDGCNDTSDDDDDEVEDEDEEDDNDDNDVDDNDDGECCDRGVSIEELVSDRKVKLNYKKMMNEYERSFAAFDQLMASRNMQHLRKDFNVND